MKFFEWGGKSAEQNEARGEHFDSSDDFFVEMMGAEIFIGRHAKLLST
ncbi:hypothetical protein NBRC111894_4556 [Sporolactobacillus inulinus]|uniref:Uncharacterized protein n=1 Tax=Sporolactobacillus inulinus TaxID=2078 RepID=A0A4Y1ZII9_9BACL|nr:hypothetical protein NBRC111894_4556 [Sporolactobacillus inulinus]